MANIEQPAILHAASIADTF